MNRDNYIIKKKIVMEEIKIPEGFVKCKACEGTGELRIRYGPSWDRGQFMTCFYCGGKGYLEKELAEYYNDHPSWWWK